MSTDEPTALKKLTAVQLHNERFAESYADALVAWGVSHPGKAPPVIKDKAGRMQWLNRRQRKAQGLA